MNTISVQVPIRGSIDIFDIQRQIATKLEKVEIEYPEMSTPIPSWKEKSYGLFRSIERWGMWA